MIIVKGPERNIQLTKFRIYIKRLFTTIFLVHNGDKMLYSCDFIDNIVGLCFVFT